MRPGDAFFAPTEAERRKSAMCKVIEDMREESFHEGVQKGIQKGIQEGILEKAREVYQALIDKGMPSEDAMQISGLKEAEAAVATA